MSRDQDNIAGNAVINYLGIALDLAERGQWSGAEANAKEAAQYAGIAEKIDDLLKVRE